MKFKIGVDEAGRGPWAGPVFASVVILSEEQEKLLLDFGVTDSKKLTEKKRTALFPLIKENSIFYKIQFLTAEQIDEVGIYKATIILIQNLVKSIPHDILNSDILIDGVFPNLELIGSLGQSLSYQCIIKGDEKEPSISAASILAKVRRDQYMSNLDAKYPAYQFGKHKGYGTKLHSELVEKFGPCIEHRKSFKPIAKLIKK